MKASIVYFDQVFLLRHWQFGLLTAKTSFHLGRLHSFPRSGTNQIRLELGDHGQYVEEEAPDRIVRIMHRPADTQLDVFGRELVNDVFRISQ